MHEVLVNRLGGLSLPRKSVVRLTDRPDMTLDVYRGRKTTIQFNSIYQLIVSARALHQFYLKPSRHELLKQHPINVDAMFTVDLLPQRYLPVWNCTAANFATSFDALGN